MKNIIIGIIVFAVVLLTSQIAQAQGTIYVSSLDQTTTGNYAAGSNSWLAVLFRTGPNSGGYTLDSIELGMANASGSPSGFTVMIYSPSLSDLGAFPGSSVDTLDGSLNPTTAGVYTYTSASNLTLSASTDYFIVLTSATAIASGAYEWNITSTFSPSLSGGWGGDNIFANSSNGSSWGYVLGAYPQFSIDAIPIPEPCVLALSGLGGLLLLWHRRKSKVV
jgi:hypothetical protein